MRTVEPRSVAVGVPCSRGGLPVPRLVEVLARLDPAPGLLLALDDGGGGRADAALQEAGFDVSRHDEPLGLGHARNTLWKRAEALGMQAVAFLDADVVPSPDYLRRVCELLVGDAVAGVGGRLIEEAPGTRVDRWRSRYWAQDLGSARLLDAPRLVGACATYRVAALREVGGFNPHFRIGGEDVDIGRRLRSTGQRLLYDPEIVARRDRRDTPLELLRGCYVQSRDGMRATVGTQGEGPGPTSLVAGLASKAGRAPASALLRRRDPREAVLGSVACGAGLLGYAIGWAKPRPR